MRFVSWPVLCVASLVGDASGASSAAYGIASGTPVCRIYGCVPHARSAALPDASTSRFGDSHVLGFAARAMPSALRGGVHTFSMSSGGMSRPARTGETRQDHRAASFARGPVFARLASRVRARLRLPRLSSAQTWRAGIGL
jgi:hypothetical protein